MRSKHRIALEIESAMDTLFVEQIIRFSVECGIDVTICMDFNRHVTVDNR